MIVAVDMIIIFINRGGGAFWNVSGGKGGGAHVPLSHTHTPTQNFQNANLFAIVTISSRSVYSQLFRWSCFVMLLGSS